MKCLWSVLYNNNLICNCDRWIIQNSGVTLSIRSKLDPVIICNPQIPHKIILDSTHPSANKDLPLDAWAIVRLTERKDFVPQKSKIWWEKTKCRTTLPDTFISDMPRYLKYLLFVTWRVSLSVRLNSLCDWEGVTEYGYRIWLQNMAPYSIGIILKCKHSTEILKFSLILDTILQVTVQFGNTRIMMCLKNATRKQVQWNAFHLEHNVFLNAMFTILHP
jgi:hypothetical protein